MKEVNWKDLAMPLAIIPYVFFGIYLFENGLNLVAGMLGFVLLGIAIGVAVMVRG